jgi:hypothetical protein
MTTLTDELGMVMIETDDAPAPVTVPEGDDPWPVLRTMGKFMPGTERGECEIMDPHRKDGGDVYHAIGLTILLGQPERLAQPVFDCRTRVVEVVELAAWLKARGYEASACQWSQPHGMLNANALTGSLAVAGNRRWQLITGKAQLPPLPSTAPDAAAITTAAAEYARHQIEVQKALASRPARYGGILSDDEYEKLATRPLGGR